MARTTSLLRLAEHVHMCSAQRLDNVTLHRQNGDAVATALADHRARQAAEALNGECND
jgi:hypothetical protein